jgi:hypothetical protein
MRATLTHGLDGVLASYPMVDRAFIRTIADEKHIGARPYLARYPANSILGWRTAQNAAGPYLTQLRLMEQIEEPDGAFTERAVPQVRVLEPGRWATWRKMKNAQTGAEEWSPYEAGLTNLDFVPFVFFYGLREGLGIGQPPLLDLAHLNVRHWQSSSDQDNILHVARVPVLFAKGFAEEDEIAIGASIAVKTSNGDATLEYVEHSGEAITAGRQSILDLENRMMQAGAELTVQRPAVTTATQIRSDDEGNRSTLQEIAEAFEDSLELCLKYMGKWVGDDSDPEVELFKDFGSANLSDTNGDLLLRAADSGHISSETAFDELKRFDVLSPSRSWEDEKTRLAQQSSPTSSEGGEK